MNDIRTTGKIIVIACVAFQDMGFYKKKWIKRCLEI